MNEQSLISFENALPILMTIFFAVLFIILLARLVFSFLFYQALKRYQKLKEVNKKIFASAAKKFIKEDEELLRKKSEIPRAHSAVKAELKARGGSSAENNSYELISSRQQELDQEELGEVKIVDIVKPVGFWTSMILGQKMTYLIQSAQIINKRNKQGFWVSMIEAKEREAGRQHARGR